MLIPAHPQFPAKNCDLALGLLLAQTPLNGVEAVVRGQGDVPPADGGAHGTCQDVGLRVKADAHPVGVHHSQGPVVAQLVAVPHLVCRWRQGTHTVKQAGRGAKEAEASCLSQQKTSVKRDYLLWTSPA